MGIDPLAARHHPLDLGGRDGRRQVDEGRLGLRGDDAGDGADLGIGEPARTEGLGDPGVVQQRPPDPHLVLGGAHADAAVPVQPEGGAATFPALIALAPVELADQQQPPSDPRSEVRGTLADLRLEALERYLGGDRHLLCHATHYTKRMFDQLAFRWLS